MPQRYVPRRFSSWSFRLGAGWMLLLLGSAGVAACLLASSSLGKTGQRRPVWKATLAAPQVTNELAALHRAAGQVAPLVLGRPGPAYALTAAGAHTTPVFRAAAYQAAAPAISPEVLAPAPATGSLKTTAQRVWATFKLGFR